MDTNSLNPIIALTFEHRTECLDGSWCTNCILMVTYHWGEWKYIGLIMKNWVWSNMMGMKACLVLYLCNTINVPMVGLLSVRAIHRYCSRDHMHINAPFFPSWMQMWTPPALFPLSRFPLSSLAAHFQHLFIHVPFFTGTYVATVLFTIKFRICCFHPFSLANISSRWTSI